MDFFFGKCRRPLSRTGSVGAQRHSTQAQITAALSSDSSTAALLSACPGPFGQFVFSGEALNDHRLDRRIEDFDNRDEQDAAGEQGRSMPVWLR